MTKRAQLELNYELELTKEQLERAHCGELVEIKIVGKLNRLRADISVGPLSGGMAMRGHETKIDMSVSESSISMVEACK